MGSSGEGQEVTFRSVGSGPAKCPADNISLKKIKKKELENEKHISSSAVAIDLTQQYLSSFTSS